MRIRVSIALKVVFTYIGAHPEYPVIIIIIIIMIITLEIIFLDIYITRNNIEII